MRSEAISTPERVGGAHGTVEGSDGASGAPDAPHGVCGGCGVPLAPSRSGHPRKWCSEPCRKSQYSRPCEKCGDPMTGSNGHGPHAPKVCRSCLDARNAERNERILEAWGRGETSVVIARREGISPVAVMGLMKHLRQRKGEPVPLHRRRNRDLWPLIEQRWLEGATGPEIAAECGITEGNLHIMVRTMREAGIDLPRRVLRSRDIETRRLRTVELWREGLSLKEIAERLGYRPGAMGMEISQMRRVGYDVPYRRVPRKAAA